MLRAGWGFGDALLPDLGLGSGESSPSGVPQPPRVLMLFVFSDDLSCYRKPCVYSARLSFHTFFCKKFSWPHLGPPRSSGPRFIEPPEPLVSTPLKPADSISCEQLNKPSPINSTRRAELYPYNMAIVS